MKIEKAGICLESGKEIARWVPVFCFPTEMRWKQPATAKDRAVFLESLMQAGGFIKSLEKFRIV